MQSIQTYILNCSFSDKDIPIHSNQNQIDCYTYDSTANSTDVMKQNFLRTHQLAPTEIKIETNVKVNTKVFDCNVCGTIFASQGGLTKHMRCVHKMYTGKKKYECSFCQESFYLTQELVNHVRTQHDKITYECRYCPKKLNTQENYRLHTLSKHKDKLSTHMNGFVPLPQSVLKVTVGRYLRNNIRSSGPIKKKDVKKEKDNVKEVYKCSKCHEIRETFAELKQHYEEMHLEAQKTQCQLCGEMLLEKDLQKHIKNAHSTTKVMKCQYCEYETNSRGRLSQHILRHFKNVDHFRCNQEGCKYKTFFSDEMEKHKKKHTFPE